MKEKSKSKSNFQLVSANFRFRAEWKKVTSRAELKIFQLELWLEPARLGLITTRWVKTELESTCYQLRCYEIFLKHPLAPCITLFLVRGKRRVNEMMTMTNLGPRSIARGQK